ncbi:methyltransferase domain-containing protein [Candidatus Microgenomates bacterium]|nr:methyltransferase domain-containing protein [Candidatus Microgenomates bacterium]
MKKLTKNKFDSFQKKHFQRAERSQFYWLTQNPYIFEKEKQILAEILKENPKKILEVGCGEGANIVNLKKLGFKGEVTGVDFSRPKITFARKKSPFAKLIVANAYKLPFKKKQFDLVFAKNLLHHVSFKEKVISEMVRVCRQRGKVIIIEGNGNNLINFVFAKLVKSETKTVDSMVTKLASLVFQEKFLGKTEILLKEPLMFFRALLHYRYGFSFLTCLSPVCLKIDDFLFPFVPKSQFGYLIIKSEKLVKPKNITDLRVEREKNHFRQLSKKDQTLWWATAAGKVRIARRGQVVADFLESEDKVLEIGSGVGEFSRHLIKAGVKIVCVDISSELVALARKEIKGKNISFRQGDAHALPFDSDSFDFVVGNSVLHHLNLSKALLGIKRVLKSGGGIIFFEPNLANPHVFLQKKVGILKRISRDSPEETAFFRWSLHSNLAKAGFKNIQVKPFDFLHPFTPKLLIGPVNKLGFILEKVPIVREVSGSLLIYAEV